MKMVTIGIPTYNRKEYLLKALNSALVQTYKNIEIIVSDNHSDDGTEAFMKGLLADNPTWTHVKYFRQEYNKGAEANWLYCLDQAQGEFFLMLSDDDVLEHDAIENLVNGMLSDVVLVIGQIIRIDDRDREIGRHNNPVGIISGEEFWQARLGKSYHDTPSGVLSQLDPLRKVLKNITNVGSTIDMTMNLLLAKNRYVNCIDAAVFRYRVHDGADSLNVMRCVKSHLALMEFMQKKEYSMAEMEVLRTYCRDTVWAYAIIALRKKRDVILMINCINALYGNLYNSHYAAWFHFFMVYGCKFLRKVVCKMKCHRLME